MTPDLQTAIETLVSEHETSFIRPKHAHVSCLQRSALAIMAGQAQGLKTRLHAGTAIWRCEDDDYWGFLFQEHMLQRLPPNAPFTALPVHVWVSYPEHNMFFDPSTGTFPAGALLEGRQWTAPSPPAPCWWKNGTQPRGAVYLPSLEASRFAARHLAEMLSL